MVVAAVGVTSSLFRKSRPQVSSSPVPLRYSGTIVRQSGKSQAVHCRRRGEQTELLAVSHIRGIRPSGDRRGGGIERWSFCLSVLDRDFRYRRSVTALPAKHTTDIVGLLNLLGGQGELVSEDTLRLDAVFACGRHCLFPRSRFRGRGLVGYQIGQVFTVQKG